MNNVVVICSDDKEVLFENARFTYGTKALDIYSRENNNLIAVFNTNNIFGVKAV